MAAKIYRINYKSDFILTMNSDAGWEVPFCIKFWTSIPSRAYYVGYDGETYTHCAYDPSEPTKLVVQFDDHHLPIGDLKFQISYHFTVDDFPNNTEDEVFNETALTTEIDGETFQVMLDFNGETAPGIDFSLPSVGVTSVNGKIGVVTLTAEDVGAQPTIADLATIRSGAAAGSTAVQPAALQEALAGKQDTIADLSTIRSGAAAGTTAVQPAGLQEGLATKQDTIADLSTIRSGAAAGATAVQPAGLTPIESALQTIEAVIPSAATSQNKLADMNYVDNKVSTSTANFVGTFETLAELQAVQNPTNNDYGFVIETDSLGNEYYDRYKFNGTTWLFEYKVESTPFTAAQWAAIQSGITSALVTKLNALPTAQQLSNQLAAKQDTISDLSTIRSGAAAGATAVQPAAMNTALAAKQDTISDLSTIRSGAAAGATAVQPATMNSALATKQNTISTVNVTVDNNTGTPSGSASVSGSTLSLSFQNLKGATGATGATGPQGPQGERGLPGESGVTGDVSGFTVIQTIDPSATYGATDIAGAATVQATNEELAELEGEQSKISVELTGSYNHEFAFVNTPSGRVTYKDVYGIDYTVGKSYTLTAKINETGGYVRIYTTTNGTSSLAANLRNNQTYTLTVASGLTAVRLGTTVDVSGTILLTANDGSIQESIESIGSDVDNLKDTMTSVVSDTSSLNLEVKGSDGQSFSFSGLNGTYLVYQEVKGLDYTVGNVYKITAAISSGSYVRVYLTKNGTRSSVTNLYNGQSYTLTVASGDTLLEIASTVDVSGIITVSIDNPLVEKIDYSYNAVNNDALIKYPFKADATFHTDQTYNFLQWFNYIRLSGCRKGCTYYVKQFYNQLMSNNLYTRKLLIYEVDSNGNEREFASYSVAGTSAQYLGIEYISNNNLIAVINWTSDIPSLRNWPNTATPLLPLCCAFNDAELILPSKIRFMSGLENYIYAQMVVRNYNTMNIQGLHYSSMRRHPRHLSWTPSNTDGSYNSVPLRLMMENRNNVLIKNMDYEVVKTTAGSGKTLRCLCIGGSSTEQGYYIDYLKSLAENDSMSITFLGTHSGNSGNAPNEGCSGWRARTFFGQYGSSDGKADRAGSTVNPFYNSNYAEFNTSAFDFSMYMTNQGYSGVDCVVLAISDNDTTATANDAAYAIDYLEAMIDSIHAYDANIKIGVWLYFAGYYQYEGVLDAIKAKQDLWEVYLNTFDGRENENIFIVPVGLGVDPLHDFPYTLSAIDSYNSNFTEIHITDWVHPSQNTGAKKVGNMCWAYLKKFGGMLS